MELVIKFDTYSRKFSSRSRKGCFNCRKRRKKCDEKKPSCSTCEAKCIECIWPNNDSDTLPKNYVVPKSRKGSITSAGESRLLIKTNETKKNSKEASKSSTSISDSQDLLPVCARSPILLPLESPSPPTLLLDHIQKDEILINACVNGFIDAVGPQPTHPLLTTNATFTPYISNNPLMELVSIACGASFMLSKDPTLKDFAKDAYRIAVAEVSSRVERQSDLWLCGASQLLVLGSKMADLPMATVVQNLNNSYKLINNRMRKCKALQCPDDIAIELENTLMKLENCHNATEIQCERMFFESFVFNYSVAILTSAPNSLPSPFTVFKKLRTFLRKPVVNCEVSWMNNPVVGAAFDAFEIASKASFLIRHFEDPSTLDSARKLLNTARYYAAPVLPASILKYPERHQRLKESIYIAEIIVRASIIILRKILNQSIKSQDYAIQTDVQFIIKRFEKLGNRSKIRTITVWAMLVTGLGCVTPEDQQVILDNCDKVSAIMHSGNIVTTVKSALLESWMDHKGVDMLLDGEALEKIIL